MSDCVLIVDAMALYKGTTWDPKTKTYVGLVDYGTAKPEPEENLATEALVFMIASITGHWKHPIAYFLQDKCSAAVQAQLIKDCIGLLHTEGLDVTALVFDGTFTNQSTAKLLGCKMKVSKRQTWFPHPQIFGAKVFVIFDVCHMVKLMRNLLGDYKVIAHEEKGMLHKIRWEYIDALNSVQEGLGFMLGNKLRRKHIDWTKHKMNVSITAQTLSSSVATAIDFLRDDIDHPAFVGSEATTDFITKVDLAFDLMNSKNPFEKGNKSPVTAENFDKWIDKCQALASYLFDLKDEKGNLLRNGCRKTVIWGFVFSMESMQCIAKDLLTRTYHPYSYVLTYKFSQDHIELLFNKLRQRGGWNNNPNVMQFKYSLRRIIIRNSIEPSQTGNCTSFEDALCESSGLVDFQTKRKQYHQLEQRQTEGPEVLEIERMMITTDNEFPDTLQDNILYYISGFIVRSLMKELHCTTCRSELLLDVNDPHALQKCSYPVQAHFTCFKQHGGLIFPSLAVLQIVKATEVLFKRRVVANTIGITQEKNLDLKIQSAVLQQVGIEIFQTHSTHFFEHRIGQEMDHLSSLIQKVSSCYLKMRLKTYGKRYSEMVVHKNKPSLRHQLTKTILFRNQ